MQVEREMGIDPAQFRRELPAALAPLPLHRQSETEMVFGTPPGPSATAIFHPLPPRRIAALTLPRMALRLSLDGFAEAEAREILRRFDRSFQRGGG